MGSGLIGPRYDGADAGSTPAAPISAVGTATIGGGLACSSFVEGDMLAIGKRV